MKLFHAEPTRRLIVSPDRDNALIVRKRAVRMETIVQEPNWDRNAPVSEFSERFKAAMRAKGWLK
jgi:hypothetical protein